jgi:hypothetical protein
LKYKSSKNSKLITLLLQVENHSTVTLLKI